MRPSTLCATSAALLLLLASAAAAALPDGSRAAPGAVLDYETALTDALVGGKPPVHTKPALLDHLPASDPTATSPSNPEASSALWGGALSMRHRQASDDAASTAAAVPPRVAPAERSAAAHTNAPALDWQWDIEQTVTTRGPRSASVAAKAQAQAQLSEAALHAAMRTASDMARQLSADVAHVVAAAEAAATHPASASKGGAASEAKLRSRLVWGVPELDVTRNETVMALSSSPTNASARGAFDIRAGWAKSRRLVRLPARAGRPAALQEVTQVEFYFTISALALALLSALLVLAGISCCLYESEEDEEAQAGADDVDVTNADEDSQRTAFLTSNGYTKL